MHGLETMRRLNREAVEREAREDAARSGNPCRCPFCDHHLSHGIVVPGEPTTTNEGR